MKDEETGGGNTVNAQGWNERIIEEFRAHEGRIGGQFEGAPLLLLHTTGARTGLDRTNPMMFLSEQGRIFVFASRAGADTNPDWFHNLLANPRVEVEMGRDRFAADAKPITGSERDRIYAIQAERYPGFAGYQANTTRVIPVVELVRI